MKLNNTKWLNKRYDSECRIIYYETFNGTHYHKHWIEYDDQGRKISYRDTYGSSTKYTYIDNKQMIIDDIKENGSHYHTIAKLNSDPIIETIYCTDGRILIRDYTKRNRYRMYVETIKYNPFLYNFNNI